MTGKSTKNEEKTQGTACRKRRTAQQSTASKHRRFKGTGKRERKTTKKKEGEKKKEKRSCTVW